MIQRRVRLFCKLAIFWVVMVLSKLRRADYKQSIIRAENDDVEACDRLLGKWQSFWS